MLYNAEGISASFLNFPPEGVPPLYTRTHINTHTQAHTHRHTHTHTQEESDKLSITQQTEASMPVLFYADALLG